MEVIEVVYNVKTKAEEVTKRTLSDEEISQIDKEQQTVKNRKKMFELKRNLSNTDYITNKLTEAITEALETGDNSKVIELRQKYSKELEDRKEWREEINQLEEELNNGN